MKNKEEKISSFTALRLVYRDKKKSLGARRTHYPLSSLCEAGSGWAPIGTPQQPLYVERLLFLFHVWQEKYVQTNIPAPAVQ
jgi:hypothetical protein